MAYQESGKYHLNIPGENALESTKPTRKRGGLGANHPGSLKGPAASARANCEEFFEAVENGVGMSGGPASLSRQYLSGDG